MRLRREKGERIKGALQATQYPNVPNNNTGIILSIIPAGTYISYNICIIVAASIENTLLYY